MSKYLDLRNKTILDFCAYEEFCAATDSDCTKDELIEASRDAVKNARIMLRYAEATNNKELRKAILIELKQELVMFYNE